jgi:hypothetical protein
MNASRHVGRCRDAPRAGGHPLGSILRCPVPRRPGGPQPGRSPDLPCAPSASAGRPWWRSSREARSRSSNVLEQEAPRMTPPDPRQSPARAQATIPALPDRRVPTVAALTTVMPNGYPQTSVVCDFDGTNIGSTRCSDSEGTEHAARPEVTLLCDPRQPERSLEVCGGRRDDRGRAAAHPMPSAPSTRASRSATS